ncbi:membrane protein [Bombiscardovia nodaiensis]|uniref:Membrane protein n=1 Tax=Bombiscardovia nodaiensis TaxID=2932181 RepID=A0ABN6SCD7_9BIFI|nr:membrane protein [Bombiscardovia nodaiensis]
MMQLITALLVACAVYAGSSASRRAMRELKPAAYAGDLPLTLLLEMVAVCVRQGASIPYALDRIGTVCQSELGVSLREVARLLNGGNDWYRAWSQACSHERYGSNLSAVRDCLEPSWRHGVSPLGRIETTIEQVDQAQQRELDQAAAGLTVKILLPTGLCILPAFILIGVLPCIAAFAGGLAF